MAADGDYNLAFDLWITNDNPPTPEGTTHEVMIWVDRTDWAPSGPEHHVAEVEIDGSEFGLFVRENPRWRYIAFAKYTDQFSGTLHLDRFLDYLVEHEIVPDDHYLAVVELGNEVLEGEGEVWFKTFEVQVR